MDHANFHGPSSLSLAMTGVSVAGGTVAQVATDSATGMAGLLISVTALLGAILSYYKEFNRAKGQEEKIARLGAELSSSKNAFTSLVEQFQKSRKTWHDERSTIAGQYDAMRIELMDAKEHRARLEGMLNITESTHRNGINNTATVVEEVAHAIGMDNVAISKIPPVDGGSKPELPPAYPVVIESDDDFNINLPPNRSNADAPKPS
jgi:hypothetical protein